MRFDAGANHPAAIQSSIGTPAPRAGRGDATAPLQMSELDPRLVDRLTDTVIRSVERRVRIERERRGL
jgi:hypothetical protein